MTQSEDPFDAPYWNLCQTRLWIGYRDPELVREYESETPYGVTAAINDFPQKRICENVNGQLLTALQSETIQCAGLMNGKGHPCIIPAHEWAYLDFKNVGRPRAAPAGAPRIGSVMWADLGFPSKEVRAEWPDPISASIRDPVTDETNSFRFIGDYWLITYGGQTQPFKNTKGLRYVAYLIQNQGKEIHVSELFYAINPQEADAIDATHSNMTEEQLGEVGLSVTDLGDAGDVLAPEGKRRIEQGIRQLQHQIDETIEFGDIEKQEMLEKKQDELVEYIQSATGKGGRSRKAASNHTRRVDAVSKAIRTAIKKIHDLHPRLGNHLQCIRLGANYIYKPDSHTNWEPISFSRFGH